MLINTTDKNCGTIIISEDIFKEQVLLHLQDGLGSFTIVDSSNEAILNRIKKEFEDAIATFDDPQNNQYSLRSIISQLREWNDVAVNNGELCSCYVLAKVNKPADEFGKFTRLIIPTKKFITTQASNYLDCQVKMALYKNDIILKDPSQLVAIMDQMQMNEGEKLLLNTADVTALYPSIDIADGLKAFDWFMETYMKDCHAQTRKFNSALAKRV